MSADPGALFRRGNELIGQGRPDAALADFDAALRIAGPHMEILNSRGMALQVLGRLDEALADFERALALKPETSVLHANRGAVLMLQGRYQDAADSLKTAVGLQPDNPISWYNYALTLRDLERFDEALAGYDRALALQPAYPDALIGRGLVLMDLYRLDEARACFDAALTLQPDHPRARINAALRDLLAGDLAKGFAGYEWRWRNPPNAGWLRGFPRPLWLGQDDLRDKTLLLHAEQGLGDTLQFCRYAAVAADRGARVILEVQKPLRRLLSTLQGPAEVIARGEPLPSFDLHCPLMSLPLALGTVPAAVPYLKADSALTAKWRTRLNPGLKVGLVWSGNADLKNDRHRSIPLPRFAPLLTGANLHFISLQKDLRANDKEWIVRNGQLTHFSGELSDFADTAALIDAMDVVISVDTAVAHLAGALGKTVYILLPHVGVDWRWMTGRTDSPWYPTAQLLRQPAPGDWDSVITRLGAELARTLQ